MRRSASIDAVRAHRLDQRAGSIGSKYARTSASAASGSMSPASEIDAFAGW